MIPQSTKRSSEREQVSVYRGRIIDEICYAFGISRSGLMRRSFAKPIKAMDLVGEEMMPAVIRIARRLLVDHLESFKNPA